MKYEAAKIITDYNGELYEHYSGRGMYGATTTGVIVDSEIDFFRAISEVIIDGNGKELKEVAEALKSIKSDNMGNGYIYY